MGSGFYIFVIFGIVVLLSQLNVCTLKNLTDYCLRMFVYLIHFLFKCTVCLL